MKRFLILGLIGFCILCGWLVVESGVVGCSSGTGGPCILLQQSAVSQDGAGGEPLFEKAAQPQGDTVVFGADNAPAQSVTLGSIDPEAEFKFQLELSSKGAAIRRVIFSEFDDRDYKDPQPLTVLSPVKLADDSEILSMANGSFVFVEKQLRLPLGRLHWRTLGVEKSSYGSQKAVFEAVIKVEGTAEAVVKLTKTYTVIPNSYHLDCDITVENLSAQGVKVRFDLTGPVGISREGFRADMRKTVAGFRDSQGQITGLRFDAKKLIKTQGPEGRRFIKPGADFLWVAATNKYFAAILRPVPEEGNVRCDWIKDKIGRIYNPDRDQRGNTGDETIGVDLKIDSSRLAAVGQPDSKKVYNFQLYIGPKDKSLFDKNQLYRDLGFVQTIDFLACCCPASIINPLAFGILAAMKWMYGFIPNYGVVIIILVFIIRIIIHPLTKKSQVSMSKMSKLAPRAEEIKKRYENSKTEMNKQLMALYKEQGASPIMGMLPMFVQMPVWIALYSAIYASIELRGAAFLPFWITDLSVPDALFRFTAVTLPVFGRLDSFNLLPILMGVAFYLQQKLMPSQASASASPQVAQQQKMMMIMMPLLFPLMLYKAPSGLNLYIMSSVFAGVVEQYIIKKHIREKGEAESQGLVAATSKTGGKIKKKKPKPFYKI